MAQKANLQVLHLAVRDVRRVADYASELACQLHDWAVPLTLLQLQVQCSIQGY